MELPWNCRDGLKNIWIKVGIKMIDAEMIKADLLSLDTRDLIKIYCEIKILVLLGLLRGAWR